MPWSASPHAGRCPLCTRRCPESENSVTLSGSIVQDPVALLLNIFPRKIAPVLVISERAFMSSEETTEAIRMLPNAALHLGMTNVVGELGLAEWLGKQDEDPLEDASEVTSVTSHRCVPCFSALAVVLIICRKSRQPSSMKVHCHT